MADNFAGMSSTMGACCTIDYLEEADGTFDYLWSAEDSSEHEEIASSDITQMQSESAPTIDTVALMESKILQCVASMSISTLKSPHPVAEVSFTDEDCPKAALGGGQGQNCVAPAMTGGHHHQELRTTPLGKRKHHPRGQAIVLSPHLAHPSSPREMEDAALTPRASNATTSACSIGGQFSKKPRGLLDTAPRFPLVEGQQDEEKKDTFSPYEQRLERLASKLPERPSRLQLCDEEEAIDTDVPSLANSLAASPALSSTKTSAGMSSVPFGTLSSTSLLSVPGKTTTTSSDVLAPSYHLSKATDDSATTALEQPASWKPPQHHHHLKMRRSDSSNRNKAIHKSPLPSFPCLSPLEVLHESPLHLYVDEDDDETPLQALA